MKNLVLCFGCLLAATLVSAQPTIEWQKAFGGSSTDQAYSIQQTVDGGYIVGGRTNSNNGDIFGNHGGIYFWILKLDGLGSIQWKKILGGSDNETPFAIHQTSDGGYVVAGNTLSNDGNVSGNHGDYDAWVVKIDSSGTILWQKTLGGSGWEEAWDVQQTTDGGYIVAGRSGSSDGDLTANYGSLDYWIVKLSIVGEIQWQKSLGGSGLDLGYSVEQTTDGGYIVAGESDSQNGHITGNHGGSDYWVVKLNFEGKIEWEKSLGGGGIDRANDIHQTRDGGYIAFGQSNSNNGDVTDNHGNNDFWVIKLGETGDLVWQKALGGANDDFARSIQQTNDDGFIMTGQTQSNNGDVIGNDGGADLWIVKINETGEIQWQKTLGGTSSETGHSVQQTNDGGYILAGQAKSNNGDVSGVHGGDDYWVIKLSPESSPTSNTQSLPLALYPNPTQESITLNIPAQEPSMTIRITDLLGRQLSQQTISNDVPGSKVLNLATLPNGLYLVSATTPSGTVYCGKVLKQE